MSEDDTFDAKRVFISGWYFEDEFAKGNRRRYGYPENGLPELQTKSMEMKPLISRLFLPD